VYGYKDSQTTNSNLVTIAWSHIVFTGSLKHQGRAGTVAITGNNIAVLVSPNTIFSTTANMTGDALHINPLSGGIAQFKGLTAAGDQLLYVEMVCRGIAPVFAKTAWQDLKGTVAGSTDNGWVFTCLTGISQCGLSIADYQTVLSPT